MQIIRYKKVIIIRLMLFIYIFRLFAPNLLHAYAFIDDFNNNILQLEQILANKDELKNKVCQNVFNYIVNSINDENFTRTINQNIDEGWQNFEKNYEKIVSETIDKLYEDSSIWECLKSNLSKEDAERITRAVLTKVVESQEFEIFLKIVLSQIPKAFSPIVEKSLNKVTATYVNAFKSFNQNFLYSIEEFFSQYQSNLSKHIALKYSDLLNFEKIQQEQQQAVMTRAYTAGAGLAILVTSQLVNKIIAKIIKLLIERIVGKIAARFLGKIASYAVPVIGTLLLLKSAYDLAQGIFPVLKNEFLSKETIQEIKSSIANLLKSNLIENSQNIAEDISKLSLEAFDKWALTIKSIHSKIKDVPSNENILANLTPEKFSSLISLSMILISKNSAKWWETIINYNNLDELLSLPISSHKIVYDTGLLDELMSWYKAAGLQNLVKIAKNDIHKYIKPNTLDKIQLEKLLLIDNKIYLSKLLSIKSIESLKTILNLGITSIKELCNTFNTKELEKIGYLFDEDQTQNNEVIRLICDKKDRFLKYLFSISFLSVYRSNISNRVQFLEYLLVANNSFIYDLLLNSNTTISWTLYKHLGISLNMFVIFTFITIFIVIIAILVHIKRSNKKYSQTRQS